MHGRHKSHNYRHRRQHKNRWLPLVVIGLLVIFVYYWFFNGVTSSQTIEYRKVLEQTKNDFIQAQRQAARDFGGKHSFDAHAHSDEEADDASIKSVIAGDINVEKDYDYDNESMTTEKSAKIDNQDVTTAPLRARNTQDSNARGKQRNATARGNITETILNKAKEKLNISKEQMARFVNKTSQGLSDLDETRREQMKKVLNSSEVHKVNKTLQMLSKHLDNFTSYVSNTSVKVSESDLVQKASNLPQQLLEKHGNNTEEAFKVLGDSFYKLKGKMKPLASNASRLDDLSVQDIIRNVGAKIKQSAVDIKKVKSTILNGTNVDSELKTKLSA